MTEQSHPVLTKSFNEFAHVIAVSSGYVDYEKSWVTMNLAICLAELGKKVCVFDAHPSPKKSMFSGYLDQEISMYEVLVGETSIEMLTQSGPGGVDVIPPSIVIGEYADLQVEHKQNLLTALSQLQEQYDYLLIDTDAGIHASTIGFLLGAGSIVITITPEPTSLNDAFKLLRGVKQRVFQQPVRVIVNLVAGEVQAKRIVTRFSMAVRKYLGEQCSGLSFFIIDDRILKYISLPDLVVLSHPNSLPSQCLKNISLRLAESGQPKSMMLSNHLPSDDISITDSRHEELQQVPLSPPQWLDEVEYSIESAPLEWVDPIMKKLNRIWNQRKGLSYDHSQKPSGFELELLKLKTAVHFASQIDTPEIKSETD